MALIRKHWLLIAALALAAWYFLKRKGAPRLTVLQGAA
jgi:hypothetical protein